MLRNIGYIKNYITIWVVSYTVLFSWFHIVAPGESGCCTDRGHSQCWRSQPMPNWVIAHPFSVNFSKYHFLFYFEFVTSPVVSGHLLPVLLCFPPNEFHLCLIVPPPQCFRPGIVIFGPSFWLMKHFFYTCAWWIWTHFFGPNSDLN